MLIKTIEELKQRIGKFIVTSQYDEKCRYEHSSMRLLTNVKENWLRQHIVPSNNTELYGWAICGKYAAELEPFMPYQQDINGETYTNIVSYARDPTQEEIKEFKNYWRKLIYPKYYIKPFHPFILIP